MGATAYLFFFKIGMIKWHDNTFWYAFIWQLCPDAGSCWLRRVCCKHVSDIWYK